MASRDTRALEAFYDRYNRIAFTLVQWRVYVTGLPQAATARSYQLWFVPKNGNPVSASVFNTNPDGSAEMEIAVPSEITALKAAAVTDEPAGGRPQPTGGFVLLGNTE